jgi:hypothetical protein
MSASTLPVRPPFLAGAPGPGRAEPLARPAGSDRPADDLDELGRRFAGVCDSAVDPLEICCALEFEGWNDRVAQERYGLPDVFALAEEMYRRVPRRPAEPEPPPDPWQASRVRPAVHGLLYGLPTVCFPAAAGLLHGPRVLDMLVVTSLAAWAISQSLAYLGYLRLGQAARAAAARLLRAGLIAGLAALLVVLACTGLAVPVGLAPVGFAAGLGGYMLGATVLIVLGAEGLLLAGAAPGVLGAAAFLLLGRPSQLAPAAGAALAVTPLLTVTLAVRRATRTAGPSLARRGRGRHARGRRSPPRERSGQDGGSLITAAELRGALPSAGFGLLAAGLLVFPVAANAPGRAGTAVLASLPLAMSMGTAEWLLIWFRRRTQRLLRSTWDLRAFASGVRLMLLAAMGQYLTITAVLTAAVAAIAAGIRLAHPHLTALPQVAAYLALGGALFSALLLQAFGSWVVPLAGCAVALGAELALRGSGIAAQLVVGSQLLIVLTGYAALVLSSATRHAC